MTRGDSFIISITIIILYCVHQLKTIHVIDYDHLRYHWRIIKCLLLARKLFCSFYVVGHLLKSLKTAAFLLQISDRNNLTVRRYILTSYQAKQEAGSVTTENEDKVKTLKEEADKLVNEIKGLTFLLIFPKK